MENVLLDGKIRIGSGTSAVRKIRALGAVPAILYAKKESPIQIEVNHKDLVKLVHKYGESSIITLKLDNNGKITDQPVIIKELQIDHIKNSVIHVDFQMVSMTEKIRVYLPLITKGDSDAPGVKEGGILEHVLHEIEIESLPINLPKQIIVDVSGLKVGDSIHVKELPMPEGVHAVSNLDQVAVLVKYEVEAKSDEEIEAEQSAGEPEVIKKGKTDEEEAKK
ncbi:MAG: 50S ribosomal protein L25 [Candidatus Omnitrophica bacterium]|nr:50S ribosomal protein L25 [Candidatus Omnitrophota bacterium]